MLKMIRKLAESWRHPSRRYRVLVLLLCMNMAQGLPGQERPPIQVPLAPLARPSATNGDQQACPPFAVSAIPVRSTIAARLDLLLESTHMRPGKKFWIRSIYPMDLPGCRMAAGAPIYGVFTSASAPKHGGGAALSMDFNAADCIGHSNQRMKAVVVGVFAPRDQRRGHNESPMELQGSGRQISDAVVSANGYDADLNDAFPSGVALGSVVGYPGMVLQPQSGPACSSQFVSKEKSVALLPGTTLLLVPESALTGR